MKSVIEEHVPGANVAHAAWTGNGVWRGKLGTHSATSAAAMKPSGQGADLGFITDSCSRSQDREQRFWRSGLRRIALHDVRVKINDRLNQSDSVTGTACDPGVAVGNNGHRAIVTRHPAHPDTFTPSMDLVSHESVQARRMPSDYLEAGHFGSGLRSLRAGSMGQVPSHIRRPITQPAVDDTACADAKTQTVCEASAQTEEDTPGPVRERVICIPSGARPASCTPVIVPVKASRKNSRTKAVRKKTSKARKAGPAEAQQLPSTKPASRQTRPTQIRPVSAPVTRKSAPGRKATAAHKQASDSTKIRHDLHRPVEYGPGADTDPPAMASSPEHGLAPTLVRPSRGTTPETRRPHSNLESPERPCLLRTAESTAAVPAECSPHPLPVESHAHGSSQTAVPACCHCSGAGVLTVSDVQGTSKEPPRVLREAPKAALPLQNPERQSMVSTLEKAVADLEHDVMARAAQPSGASGPSFANSLESLAALEAEITAQQRRLVSVGVVPRGGGLDQPLRELQPAATSPCPAPAACELHNGQRQQRFASAGSLGPQGSFPQKEAWMPTSALMRGVHDSALHLPQQGFEPSSHLLLPEPSFSHTASSTLGSNRNGAAEPLHDRDSSSSPDGNFSTVSIEDRLKRLGLSDQISQLIKDITADTESTSSPAHSAGDRLPWLRMVGTASDTASTVTLPSLAPPKPLDARQGLRSSSASPLDEFPSSRTNDAGQVSPTLAGRLPFSQQSNAGRTPSPTDSSPSMPGPNTAVRFPQPSGSSQPSRSGSERTDDWRGGANFSDQSHRDGPFGDTSTARSMDEVLSTVMRGTPSCTGSDCGRSASLQLGNDTSAEEHAVYASPGDNMFGGQKSPQQSAPLVPFLDRQPESDKSYMSPLASSDTSMRADSTTATPVDLRADVDSILCGSFWRS